MANIARGLRGFGRRKPQVGFSVDFSHPLARGLVGCYLFNEATDTINNNLANGSLNLAWGTSPAWSASGYFAGPCINFTSASSTFIEGTAPITAAPLSIMVWFNPTDTTSNFDVVSIGSNSSSNYFHVFLNGGSGSPNLVASMNGGSGENGAVANGAYVANAWNQAVGVYPNVSNRICYLNGTNKATNTSSIGTPSGINKIDIGRLIQLSPSQYLNGSVDHVCVWNRILTDGEVMWLYQQPFDYMIQVPIRRSHHFLVTFTSSNTLFPIGFGV